MAKLILGLRVPSPTPPSEGSPTISAASITDGVLSVSGSGFGTKSTAAPIKFQDFSANSQGDRYGAAGFDFCTVDDANNIVDKSADGQLFGANGSWLTRKTAADENEYFTHFGDYLDNLDAIFFSYWIKINLLNENTETGLGQYKGARTGYRNGGTSTDPGANYAAWPKYSWVMYFFGEGLPSNVPEALSGPQLTVTDYSNTSDTYNPPVSNVALLGGLWQYVEGYCRWNDIGEANGIAQLLMNGTQFVDISNSQRRFNVGESFQYIMYNPGFANDLSYSIMDGYVSRIYLDNTRARVFLGNASTLASCTRRFMLPPSAWSGTEITAGSATGIPSGYDWVYVSNSDGEINANGFEYA